MKQILTYLVDHVLNLKGLMGARTVFVKAIVLALAGWQALAVNPQIHALIPLQPIDPTTFNVLLGLLVERGLKFAANHNL